MHKKVISKIMMVKGELLNNAGLPVTSMDFIGVRSFSSGPSSQVRPPHNRNTDILPVNKLRSSQRFDRLGRIGKSSPDSLSPRIGKPLHMKILLTLLGLCLFIENFNCRHKPAFVRIYMISTQHFSLLNFFVKKYAKNAFFCGVGQHQK